MGLPCPHGLTYAEVRLVGPLGDATLPLVVDTDSLLTWISRERLAAIGVEPKGVRKIQTLDGSEVNREIGEIMIEVMGEKVTRLVVLAEPSDAEVLGVDSLEDLGLEVDPATRAIRKPTLLRSCPTCLPRWGGASSLLLEPSRGGPLDPIVLIAPLLIAGHPLWALYENFWVALTHGMCNDQAFGDSHRVRLAHVYAVVSAIAVVFAVGYWRLIGLWR